MHADERRSLQWDGNGKRYPQQNRPDGLSHWLQNVDIADDTILVVLDPDQLFLKPLTQNAELERPALIQNWGGDRYIARPGKPVGQGYGIASFKKYRKVCEETFGVDPTEGCQAAIIAEETTDPQHMHRHYSVGAPYIMAAGDMRRLAPLWSKLTPGVHEIVNRIEADMWAYSMAAAHLGLAHDRVENHMISDPLGATRWEGPAAHKTASVEGWHWIDGAYLAKDAPLAAQHPCRCHTPVHSPDPRAQLPTLMHYCQTYKVYHDEPGLSFQFGTSKYRMGNDMDILECDHPLLAEPWAPSPPGVDILGHSTPDRWRKYRDPGLTQDERFPREAFAMCEVVLLWNVALLDFKKTWCPSGYNESKVYYQQNL
jgi:hypothetical protein